MNFPVLKMAQIRNKARLDKVVAWFKREIPEKTYFLEKPPHPSQYPFPWLMNYIWKPMFRWGERQGVHFYNSILNKTEIGLYPKEYNPRVHGMYCAWRYYGNNPDVPVWDVKIKDLGKWFSRRDYSPRAMWMEFRRWFYQLYFDYHYGPRFGNPVEGFFRALWAFVFVQFFIGTFIFHKWDYNSQALYHW